ncbi:MAG: translation initiation factor IF-2 [Aestuariivita sp.]|nr:translation initiation factor IF-2 [Aestuariivita sp.]MCY4203117.1 translation initiation factor IF-2 [Aestuariivita sp.]
MNSTARKKTLGLRTTPQSGSVTQSFSHGRTKNVVIETKRKRVIVPRPGRTKATRPSEITKPLGVSTPIEGLTAPDPTPIPVDSPKPDIDRRIKAVQAAKASEAAEREKREALEKEREETRERRRQELQAKQKDEQERLERTRAKEDSELNRKSQDQTELGQPIDAIPTLGTTAAKDNRGKGTAPRKVERERTEERGKVGKGRASDSERRAGKLTLSQVLSATEGGRQRSMAAIKRKQERDRKKAAMANVEREKIVREVQLPEMIVVSELANRMAERSADVVKELMKNGMLVTQNQSIDADTAELIIAEFGHKVVRVSDADVEDVIQTAADLEENLLPRAPVITIMGHVDHGKTSLLDAIRNANVTAGESGGITQHIGAYQVRTSDNSSLTFLDTPGHEAFTSMRSRGAQITDIVVLVVAADDSVMPQTVEAINHAKAADVPIVVAINKIDKPDANPEKVRSELLQHQVIVEKLSGDVQDVEVSATTGQGLDDLLERIALQSELLELRSNPNRAAEGAVIEAKLDVGRGPVATVLVQKGTLNQGDVFVVGEQWGRVRAMENDLGQRIASAGPSVPVEVLGLNGAPEAGDILNVVETDAQAREIADYREKLAKDKRAAAGTAATLDQLLAKAKADSSTAELPIVVKADVRGSAEAIVQAMEKVGNDEVRVRVLHYGVGAITESDVALAEASEAPIIGFNVRANAPARNSANRKGVDIRYYSVIYNLVDEVKAAASGLLTAEIRENRIGYAEVKEIFNVSGIGRIAGCLVTEGVSRKSANVRVLRDDIVLHEGTLKSLKRFKDEVAEVQSGQECGIALENYSDIRQGDVIEMFESEQIARTLA